MDDRTSLQLRGAFLVPAALAFATVAGFVLAAAVVSEWWVWILAILVGLATALAQYRLYRQSNAPKLIEFSGELDPKFTEFFSDWYGQDGSHYIFCKDLDWLDRPQLVRIVETLRNRGRKVTIFVSEDEARACARIRQNGAQILVVPRDVAEIRVKMSLHIDDADSKEIIVQRKKEGASTVRFTQTTDSNMVGLAETLMAACSHIANATDQNSIMVVKPRDAE